MAKGIRIGSTKRRLSSSSAGHDCFACTKKQLQCDRQRPYCSQCLANHNQCPGYQVSLTWGIGIASRGKFRGQTCPVLPNNSSPFENHCSIEAQIHEPELSGLIQTANSFQWGNYQSNLSTQLLSKQDIQPNSLLLESYTGSEAEAEIPTARGILPCSFGDINPEQDHIRDLIFVDHPQGLCGNLEQVTNDIKDHWRNDPPICLNESHGRQPWPKNSGIMSPLSTSLSQTLVQTWPGSTPRIRYLVNYFSQRIASNLVEFDHISNPFQSFILYMACESKMLQHAIAAIAASHIQQVGLDLGSPTSSPSLKGGFGTGEDAEGSEDFVHRTRAVQCLNGQLADTKNRYKDDVVVAFLLLVLYHLCKSGVNNPQSQLSGARRLLELRHVGRANSTHVIHFCIQMFTWIDILTSMVNNRSATFSNPYVTMACQGDGDWTLENTTGCDGLLFQEIGKLSQLRSFLHDEQYCTKFSGDLLEEARSRIEGWERLAAGCNYPSLSPRASFPISDTATRTKNPNSIESMIVTISELFRNASLIYCQRIIFPELPSSHHLIQNLVSRALKYVENIDGSSRILWPLLIVGFECVYAEQQNIVRRKLQGIFRLSGFAIHRQALDILQSTWDALEMEYLSLSIGTPSEDRHLYSGIHNRCNPRNGWIIWRALSDSQSHNQGCAIF